MVTSLSTIVGLGNCEADCLVSRLRRDLSGEVVDHRCICGQTLCNLRDGSEGLTVVATLNDNLGRTVVVVLLTLLEVEVEVRLCFRQGSLEVVVSLRIVLAAMPC